MKKLNSLIIWLDLIYNNKIFATTTKIMHGPALKYINKIRINDEDRVAQITCYFVNKLHTYVLPHVIYKEITNHMRLRFKSHMIS